MKSVLVVDKDNDNFPLMIIRFKEDNKDNNKIIGKAIGKAWEKYDYTTDDLEALLVHEDLIEDIEYINADNYLLF